MMLLCTYILQMFFSVVPFILQIADIEMKGL